MALQVNASLTTDFGYVINSPVWKLSILTVNVNEAHIYAVLNCYVDVNAIQTNKKSVAEKTYSISGLNFASVVLQQPIGNTLSDVISNAVYDYVKANDPYFANAIDV